MNKPLRYIITGMIAGVLLISVFTGGFAAGYLIKEELPADFLSAPTAPTPSPETAEATPDELDTLFAPFWESWQIVHDSYVDQPVDDLKLMQGAISGMLDSLGDQHTSYMDPHQYTQANSSIEGSYDGIGAWVDSTGDYLAIVSPMPGSPAEEAGLKPGDLVIAIDGEDMTGIDGDLVIRRVLGPAGSTVHLTIHRDGESEPLEFDVTRAHITIPSVESELLENNIGYIHIFTFSTKTTPELRAALEDLLEQGAEGFIVDFRNNGGGLLNTAIEVASEFIPEGEVVLYEQYGDGRRDIHEALQGGQATDLPIIVLINEGSASASEVVAGAIQDLERGQLLGVTSFGKGSVQNWIPLNNDQGAVRVTIAKWLTPSERTIHKIGLEPDIVVEITEEDIEAERDSQLDKAVDILTDLIDQE
ncbi:MAG: S41 family peptidase [Anaerolineae bacterium]|jgi:carboxyl-terminal processing protease|nr:S41 family peptidase [Anaerolineae bacterium]MBT4458849.1 S41 family peptidase [Anaerolineae bacterium]MBT4842633.1 S41 family peptidase [Anaerolineae bacterium]MBT6059914.1 S41 family peptidase [Anaerolineae bacterium]MBT6323954.1 S41 family peptidase [Anaerolineae bacterium]